MKKMKISKDKIAKAYSFASFTTRVLQYEWIFRAIS